MIVICSERDLGDKNHPLPYPEAAGLKCVNADNLSSRVTSKDGKVTGWFELLNPFSHCFEAFRTSGGEAQSAAGL